MDELSVSQADILARMSVMGNLVQEQWEEDTACLWRLRRQHRWQMLGLQERLPRRPNKRPESWITKRACLGKKARAESDDVGASAALMEEAKEGMEFPEAPCKQCVCY